MSLSNDSHHRHVAAFKLPALLGQENYARWKLQLQNFMFRLLRNNDMDLLTRTKTLDGAHFAKHPAFADDFKTAARAAKNADFAGAVLDFDKDLADRCFRSAIAGGEGFHPWVYDLWFQITTCLSDKISDKVQAVRAGDVVKLLDSIKLALLHYERYDPTDIEIQYSAASMTVEGDNDLMTFTTYLSSSIQRLEAAGAAPDAKKKQWVLLNGLDQVIFESFINNIEGKPMQAYDDLQAELERTAAKPHYMAKLRALKPGLPSAGMHATREDAASTPDSPDAWQDKICRIESILSTITKNQTATRADPATKARGPCFSMRDKGSCARGDDCRFSHVNLQQRQQGGPHSNRRQGPTCLLHGLRGTHESEDCRVLKNDPILKSRLQAVKNAQDDRRHQGTRAAAPEQQFHSNTSANGYDFMFPLLAAPACHTMPQHMFSCSTSAKIDMWCVDGAATAMGTFDRSKCTNIRPCAVQIFGANSAVEVDSMVCKEMGDVEIATIDPLTGRPRTTLLTGVLISEHFPFHIFSEIVAFDKGCQASKTKGSWTFRDSDGNHVLHASQQLLDNTQLQGRSDNRLYFIDEARFHTKVKVQSAFRHHASGQSAQMLESPFASRTAPRGSQSFTCTTCTFVQPRAGSGICIMCNAHTDVPARPAIRDETGEEQVRLRRAAAQPPNSAMVSTPAQALQLAPSTWPLYCDLTADSDDENADDEMLSTAMTVWSGVEDIHSLRHRELPAQQQSSARMYVTRTAASSMSTAATTPSQLATTSPSPCANNLTQQLAYTKPISTAKNLSMLIELHCAHAHWNFEDVASQYGLSLPIPRPACWACYLAKPRHITPDKLSTRQLLRVFEGLSADAKGPINTATPEGYKYFFLIVDLYSSYYWPILAKSQAEWKDIWPCFVRKAMARTGSASTVAFLITDGHRVPCTPLTTSPTSTAGTASSRLLQLRTRSGGTPLSAESRSS